MSDNNNKIISSSAPLTQPPDKLDIPVSLLIELIDAK